MDNQGDKVKFDDLSDKQIYDFVEKYGDEYDEKYGYFRGENTPPRG